MAFVLLLSSAAASAVLEVHVRDPSRSTASSFQYTAGSASEAFAIVRRIRQGVKPPNTHTSAICTHLHAQRCYLYCWDADLRDVDQLHALPHLPPNLLFWGFADFIRAAHCR